MKYLLDSVIVIDHLNGVAAASAFLSEHSKDCALSVITRAEVLAGVVPTTERPVTVLLDRFPTLPITAEVADRAAQLRRNHRWKLPDALQASTAELAGLILVTRDTRDFGPGAPIRTLAPYALEH